MEEKIEDAIRGTLVIANKESVHIAVEKIIRILDYYKPTHCDASGFTMEMLNEIDN